MRPVRVPRQALVLAVAGALWAIAREPALWALVAAYGAAWLAVNALIAWRPGIAELSLGRVQIAVAAAVLVAPPAAALWSVRDSLLENESLLGVEANVSDRIRLEDTPSIAPPVVFADHPQTFYVHAPGTSRVRVQLGEAQPLDAVDLGEGLFRVEYDPRHHGAPAPEEGDADATLVVDGASVSRTVRVVHPLAHPRWLRASPDRTLAAVPSEETDQVAVLDARGLVTVAEVGDGPTDAVFVSPDRIAVSHRHDDALVVIDARTGRTLSRTPLDRFQVRMAVSPDRTRLAVAVDGPRRGVHLLQMGQSQSQRFVPLELAPDWIVFGPDADTLIVSSRRPAALHRLRRGPSGWAPDAEPLLLGRPAVTLARTPDGARVLLATTDYRPDGRPHLGNHFVQDQILTVDVARWRVEAQQLTARRSERQGSPGDVDRGVSPMGLDPLPDGRVRVAFAGSDEAWEVVPGRPTPRIVPLDGLPLPAPHGVVELSGGQWLVSSPAGGAIGILSPDGSLSTLVRLAPDDDDLLADAPEALKRRMGEHGFYETTRSGVSCQSCHLHADTDGARHNIGEQRLAPTLTVRGVAGTAPYLRDGSFPRLRDLNDLSRTLYHGFRRRAPGRAVTLEAYVEGLPRRPSPLAPATRDVERERRGVAAFVKASWLFERCSSQWAIESAARRRWRGLSLFATDGTTLRVADSEANREHYGLASGGGRADSGYPVLRLAGVIAVRSHLLAAAAFEGARFLTIEGCEIHGTADVALRMNDSGVTYEYVHIIRNHIHDTDGTGEGMYLGCNEDGCRLAESLIAENWVHHTDQDTVSQGDGIELKEGSYANVIRDNVIHDTNYPCILTYSTVGNGDPNIIERNVMWNCGDHAIQSAADATIRNNIILSAGASGISMQPHQNGDPSNLVVVHNTVLQATNHAINVSGITGSVLIANNAAYAMSGSAIRIAGGDTSMLVIAGNVGVGGLSGASDGLAAGDLDADFVSAHWSGAPPIDVFPAAGGALVAAGDTTHVAEDDFNGTARGGVADVGAYAFAEGGNPGWTIAEGFKELGGTTPGTDAGTPPPDGGAGGGTDAGGGGGDDGGGPGADAGAGGGGGAEDDGGCGCRIARPATRPRAVLLALGALVLVRIRRRCRRRATRT